MTTAVAQTQARLRRWLAFGYTLFIVYASLSPFEGWQEQGLDFMRIMSQPFVRTYTAFDAIVNLVTYIPLGFLFGLVLRARLDTFASMIGAFIFCVLLSANMEFVQMYLPSRVSSNMDLLTNSLGGLFGAIVAVRLTLWAGWYSSILRWRIRSFYLGTDMDFGLALLVLWMFGQMNPTFPMLGNVFISQVPHQPFAVVQPEPFEWLTVISVTLNLLMLGGLLMTALRARRNIVMALFLVISFVALSKFLIAAAVLKSWALLLWINSESVLGIMLGVILLLLAQLLPHYRLIQIAMMVTLAYLMMVNNLYDRDAPAKVMSIYAWNYRHLLNFNGLSQSLMIIFPALLLFYLWRIRRFRT